MITGHTLDRMRRQIEVANLQGNTTLAVKLTKELKRLTKVHAIHENMRKVTLNKLIQELEQPRFIWPDRENPLLGEIPEGW